MRSAPITLLACALASCAPSLDWREVRDGDAPVVALFPCRPDRMEREVALGAARQRMRLLSCGSAGMTFALGHVELEDPAAVTSALGALRSAVQANVGASVAQHTPWQPPGATPNALAGMQSVEGRLPDGAPLRMRAALFVHGRGVWQASVVGAELSEPAVQAFFDGLRVGR